MLTTYLRLDRLSFGMLQLPTLGLAASYSSTGDAAEGAVSKEMNAAIALYLLVWGFALLTFWLFTMRINLVFAGIFGFVTLGAWVLSGAYWALSNGLFERALRLQKVSRRFYRFFSFVLTLNRLAALSFS